MEIGFAMAMEMDPTTQVQTTITSTVFTAIFMLIFLASDMHYFVIEALVDSYQMIPIGGAVFHSSLYEIFVKYITDYFIIGFRIILPVFACILIVNVVLGILAKVAPQMNMFVIGMQLKVFVGLALLYFLMSLFPGVVDFIFEEMQLLTRYFMQSMVT
jgi:flagellar biosynthetic protein FliR